MLGVDERPLFAGTFALGFDAAFERLHQLCMDVLRNRFGIQSLEYFKCLKRRVTHDPAVRAFVDVLLELGLHIRVERLIEELVEILKKLFTGKQTRRPLFA